MNHDEMRMRLEKKLLPNSEWLEYLLFEAIEMQESGKKGMSIPAHMSRSGIVDFVTFPISKQ